MQGERPILGGTARDRQGQAANVGRRRNLPSARPKSLDEHCSVRVCEVLRRAATGDTLQGDESQLLTQLQLAFRDNLERRRRAATTIWRAYAGAATG